MNNLKLKYDADCELLLEKHNAAGKTLWASFEADCSASPAKHEADCAALWTEYKVGCAALWVAYDTRRKALG